MNIAVIIDSINYKCHKEYILDFKKECDIANIGVVCLDLSLENVSLSTCFNNEDFDWLVSFDMVGFEIRTINEMTFYNESHLKMVHILFDKVDSYRYIQDIMNFSMFLSINTNTQNQSISQIANNYPNLPNVMEFKDFSNLLTWIPQIKF